MTNYPKNPDEIAKSLNEEITIDPSKLTPRQIYNHAARVLDRRWPEAERYLMKDTMWAYEYAKDVIRGRWTEAEPYIMKDPETAYFYARDLIKGRWKEYEEYMIPDNSNPMDDHEDSVDDIWWTRYQREIANS